MRLTTFAAWLRIAVTTAAVTFVGVARSLDNRAVAQRADGSRLTSNGEAGFITSLDMKSPFIGWAWGPTAVVRTLDGAAHLADVTPPGVDDPHLIVAEYALNAARAWVVARSAYQENRFTVYRTLNGGATWVSTTIHSDLIDFITFVDATHGWIQSSRLVGNHRESEATLSRTVDGGRTWSTVYRTTQRISIQPNVQVGGCQWGSVTFSSALHGVVGLSCDRSGTPQVDITDNGGKSWKRTSLPALRRPPGIVLFSTVEQPFLSGATGAAFVDVCAGSSQSCNFYSALYRTTDGGRTWHEGRAVVHGGQPALFADARHVWVAFGCLTTCTSTPLLLQTRDGGAHWGAMTLSPALGRNVNGVSQLQFVSPSVGFAVATGRRAVRTQWFRTTDGGRTFQTFVPHVIGR